MVKEPVIIVGAGPAGLAAGLRLLQLGIRPLIVEKSNQVGGLSRTEHFGEYRFDLGGHRFFTTFPEVSRLWHELLGPRLITVQRKSRVYYQGRFYDYPLKISNTLYNLGPWQSVMILAGYLHARLFPDTPEDTFEQWVTNRFGRRLYSIFFKTYTEKVWGLPGHEIQADWASERIKGLSLAEALSKAISGHSRSKTLIDEFLYPLTGPGLMWDCFRENIESGGGSIHLEHEALRLEHDHQDIRAVVCLHQGREISFDCGHCLSTQPINRLVEMLSPKPPSGVLAAAAGLSHRAFIIVLLIIDRRDVFPDQWIYIHSPEVRVGRIQNFKNWSPQMVPHHDKTSLGMEYFCNAGDELWSADDDSLLDLAKNELAALGLAAASEVTSGYVVRQPYAYPVYNRNYQRHLEVLKTHCRAFPNLQTVGRSGMHRYNNMDHSIYAGLLAAENTTGAAHDLWDLGDGAYLEEAGSRAVSDRILIRAMARTDNLAMATAMGVTTGLFLWLATIWLLVKGGPVIGPNLALLAQYFPGFTVTFGGAFIAFGYSFFWGFIFGWLFSYLRNLLLSIYAYRVGSRWKSASLRDFLDHF